MVFPFPGMNPYLEHPSLWAGIHHRLITAIANILSPQIRPKYIVAIEERVYQIREDMSLLVGVPDVSIQRNLINDTNLALLSSTTEPLEVIFPQPEIVTEGYLEIQGVETGEECVCSDSTTSYSFTN